MKRSFASLLLTLAVACGGPRGASDAGVIDADVLQADGAEPDAPYVEATCTPDADDTYCPAYAEAFCEGHLSCCTSTEPGFRYESMVLCVQRTLCICAAARTGEAFTSGRVNLDVAASEAVLTAVRDAADGCDPVSLDALAPESAFVGSLPEGADCSPVETDFSNLYACARGLYCYVTDFGEAGVPPTADCRRYRTEGEPCDAIGMGCAAGLYCADGPTFEDPGVCRALLPSGTSCVSDFECATDLCDEATGTCAAADPDDTWCVDTASE